MTLSQYAKCTFATLLVLGLPLEPCQSQDVSFSQEVQPLLARRCFACHGPDQQEGGLRLNSAEAALQPLDSGATAIVPGKPDESELLRRITTEDEDLRMPPEGKPLTEREQLTLRSWIEQGAVWKQHWAFEPVLRPQPPTAVPDAVPAAQHPVDAFIDAKLIRRGLTRSPRAEPQVLLRRLYFDLIGLPPTPEQVETFLSAAQLDPEAAWEAEIDRLLASEHYGERWARHWLDVVRYAETNSFERDGAKPHAWRYRDYVIRAFNDDKPYDQFLREQLAGDELPEVTPDSLIATGFYRLGIWDDEPADRALAMYEGLDDIITTVGQGILGLTLNCSRCHDHKIDPIPAADYYSTLAFFRNLTANGYGPNVERPLLATAEDRQRFVSQEQQIRDDGDRLQQRLTELETTLRQQLAEHSDSQTRIYDLDDLEYRFYRDNFRQLPDFDQLKPETVAKAEQPLIDISVATRPDNFGFVFTAHLIVPADGEYQFVLDSDDGSRLTVDGKQLIEYDGIHGVGSPRRAKAYLKQGRYPLRVDYFQGMFGKGLHLHWSGPGFRRRSLTAEESLSGKDLNEALKSPEANSLDPATIAEYRQVRRDLEENKRRKPWDAYGMCVSEQGTRPPETFVLLRGNPESHGERVEPAFLSILGGGSPTVEPNPQANTSGRRLAFADWVTSPENRLTSRVFANRIWQHHFGRGIVRSSNNFGLLGEPPTHPELLDWLATELVRGGWRVKPLHKLILTSETWRQSSLASDEALEMDTANDLFSRFDIRRLSAEEIRDTMLAVNGQLNPEPYGPSIYPEISREVLAGQSVPGKGWGKSSPRDQARRSVYIHVKRSLLLPMLSNFDFPEPDGSCEARFMTTQPGQALGLLNGDFANEQAAAFAERLRREHPDDRDGQLQRGLQLTFSRPPREPELARGKEFMDQLKQKHGMDDAQSLTYLCLLLYNLNEFMYVD
jgi:hypothetical protein